MKLETVKNYLEREPRARERKNKYRTVANLLSKKYKTHLDSIPKSTLEDIVYEATQGDRAWRRVTQTHKHLRGEDYEDNKQELQRGAQGALGYNG